MDINRRNVVTGLAALAVAGVAAPLPAIADAWDDPYVFSLRNVVLRSPWYYDQTPTGRILIQHFNARVTFVNDPWPDGSPYFHFEVGNPENLTWSVFAEAAGIVACHAYLLRSMRGHRGAIYLRYPHRSYDDTITEDAPPFGSFGQEKSRQEGLLWPARDGCTVRASSGAVAFKVGLFAAIPFNIRLAAGS